MINLLTNSTIAKRKFVNSIVVQDILERDLLSQVLG